LHLVPTYTHDYIGGEHLLTSGNINIPDHECTDSWNWGCDRTGSSEYILNPIRSARIDTLNSFRFKYGTLEMRAKMPAGDWLWPALWMMPSESVYGQWPRSGEIDLTEARGNRNLLSNGGHVGIQQVGSTMHFGPDPSWNGWASTHSSRNQYPGFDENFHDYKVVWTPDYIQFFVDGTVLGTVDFGSGFWDRGGFGASGLPNPWAGATRAAPFDQEFYVIINLAIGGTNYFDDSFVNAPCAKVRFLIPMLNP